MGSTQPLSRKIVFGVLAAAVVAALGYGIYRRYPLLKEKLAARGAQTSDALHEPDLPKEPPNADGQLKGMYKAAIDARDKRLLESSYVNFMNEGLEWKTVGDFSPSGKSVYYGYAAYIYSQAAEKFDKEWVPWHNVGDMFQLIAEYGRAEQAYKKAIELEPRLSTNYDSLIEMLTARNAFPSPDILTFFRNRLFGITDNRRPTVIVYARYLLQNGMNKEAFSIVETATKQDPGEETLQAEYYDLKKYFAEHPDQLKDATRDQPTGAKVD